MQRIPKLIHLIYFNSNPAIPEDYRAYLDCIKQFHPHWEIKIYGREEARSIIAEHTPELITLYDNYPLEVQRLDIFKLMVVYVHGGFYMDFDMLCFKSMDELCDHPLVLAEEVTLSDRECASKGLQHSMRIANYTFGAIPGHPFWYDVIQEIVARSGKKIVTEDDILTTTGPGVLTDVYHTVKEHYQDIVLLPNHGKVCLKACERASCHFGEFAAHLHQGKWRWEELVPGAQPLDPFREG